MMGILLYVLALVSQRQDNGVFGVGGECFLIVSAPGSMGFSLLTVSASNSSNSVLSIPLAIGSSCSMRVF